MRSLLLLMLVSLTGCSEEVFTPEPRFSPDPSAETDTIVPTRPSLVVTPPYLALAQPGKQSSLATESSDASMEIVWLSENRRIATVDAAGVVTAIAPGTTKIWAVGERLAAYCYLVVRTPPPPTPSPPTAPEETEASPSPEPIVCDPLGDKDDPFADRVVSYEVGERGGFHEESLPEIVLGPPHGAGNGPGGLDVFSLGEEGEIILEFIDYLPCDGPGPDLIVFENTWGNFFEPAIVSVSDDGETWHPFPCEEIAPSFTGCAGLTPVYADPDENEIDPTEPATAGGDSFDLATVELSQARFIKITDINSCDVYHDMAHCTDGFTPGILGFDLDAVSVVNGKYP